MTRASQISLVTIAVLLALFFLQAARDLFIPVVVAVLLSYILDPIVRGLMRLKLPRAAAAAILMLALLAGSAAAAYAWRAQITDGIQTIPAALERVSQAARGIAGGAGDQAGGGGLAARAASSLMSIAGHGTLVFFLVLFLLMAGEKAGERLVDAIGTDARRRKAVSAILDEINAQIPRFLLATAVACIFVGIATWLALLWMGVERAALWGALAGLFNAIPYLGPVIVSGGLFAVGMMQGGGVAQGAQMAGVALVITSIEGWVLTPPLMGKVERMNALAVFLGLVLWTWIWGAWGTLLAVPMLVVMKAIARNVDALKPLAKLLEP